MLSVIIPTSNSERGLALTLPMLVPGAMNGLVREVMVVDDGSTDNSLMIADAAGCVLHDSRAPLGRRLRDAAAAARSRWLMFLRPGTVLEPTWVEETARFIADAVGSTEPPAAVFRRSVPAQARAPAMREAAGLMAFAVFGRVSPSQGLLIGISLYKQVGGHREAAADTEKDLLARLGRRRIVMLRSGART